MIYGKDFITGVTLKMLSIYLVIINQGKLNDVLPILFPLPIVTITNSKGWIKMLEKWPVITKLLTKASWYFQWYRVILSFLRSITNFSLRMETILVNGVRFQIQPLKFFLSICLGALFQWFQSFMGEKKVSLTNLLMPKQMFGQPHFEHLKKVAYILFHTHLPSQ